MPIKVPDHLPAKDILSKEKIFLMDESRAFHQDIRPLQIAILNLMPLKEDTEVQLLRKLGNTPIQVEVVLIHPKDHVSKNTPAEHLINFYKTFDEIKNNKYDGMIITGAPIENMEFEQVHYWNEISEIMEWTNTNVFNTFHICWGAQAGLYYHYNVPKIPLEKKLFGVFSHNVVQGKECNQFVRGFDDVFYVPHSRHTSICVDDVEKVKELEILAVSPEAGLYLAASKDGSKLFVTGHSEYNRDTLDKEYKRDIGKGLAIDMPLHYYLRDDTNSIPQAIWRAHGNLLYSNWLNYVYQETPYEMDNIGKDRK